MMMPLDDKEVLIELWTLPRSAERRGELIRVEKHFMVITPTRDGTEISFDPPVNIPPRSEARMVLPVK